MFAFIFLFGLYNTRCLPVLLLWFRVNSSTRLHVRLSAIDEVGISSFCLRQFIQSSRSFIITFTRLLPLVRLFFVCYLLLPACGKDMDIVCTVLPDLCCNAIICLPIPLFFVPQAYFVALCILHSK